VQLELGVARAKEVEPVPEPPEVVKVSHVLTVEVVVEFEMDKEDCGARNVNTKAAELAST
jgi:hypothetical protein